MSGAEFIKVLFQNRVRAAGTFAFTAALLCGCTVGPNYHRPAAPVPANWDVQEPWRESAPKDALPKGQWWVVFHDDQLNALEKESLDANQTMKISVARLEQARATAAVQLSTLFPTFGLVPGTTPTIERQRLSGNRPVAGSPITPGPVQQNSATLPFVVNYELDLFGKRRRSIESAEAAYQASAADLENVRLVITAELAGDYYSLRQLDSEIGILERTVQALQKGLDLVNSRHDGGVASGLDVAEEETLLRNTQTQAILRQQQRRIARAEWFFTGARRKLRQCRRSFSAAGYLILYRVLEKLVTCDRLNLLRDFTTSIDLSSICLTSFGNIRIIEL